MSAKAPQTQPPRHTVMGSLQGPIAFAHYSLANDISGVTTWLRDLLLRLHADGVPLVVLLHHLHGEPQDSSLAATLRDSGITVEIHGRAATMDEDLVNVRDFLDRHEPSAFLPQCLNVFYYAAAAAGAQGLPWCMTLHSDDPDYWAIAEALPAERFGGRTICVSKHLVDETKSRGLAARPIMIPYGASLPLQRAAYNDQPFTVVFSGRMLEEQKRLSLVLKTLTLACGMDGRINAVLIGDGQGSQAAQAQVAEAGLAERIRFTGRLAPEVVFGELRKSQAILLMSDYEGLPLSLLEAMALGLVPVVRSIPSGIPELVQDGITGVLVNEDPEKAATALVALMNDPDRWGRCSLAAHALIEQEYSADRSYAAWVEHLEQLVRSNDSTFPLDRGRDSKLPVAGSLLGKGYMARPIKPTIIRRVVNKLKRVLQ